MAASRFDEFAMGAGIEVVEVMEAFKHDSDPGKMNLSVLEYMTPGKGTVLMKTVAEAEARIIDDPNRHHGYLHALGIPDINQAAVNLLLGPDHPAIKGIFLSCLKNKADFEETSQH